MGGYSDATSGLSRHKPEFICANNRKCYGIYSGNARSWAASPISDQSCQRLEDSLGSVRSYMAHTTGARRVRRPGFGELSRRVDAGEFASHTGRWTNLNSLCGWFGYAVQVRAGIFQDGSTYGDPEWTAILLKRREQHVAALDAFIRELEAATSGALPQADLIERLQTLRDAQLASITASSPAATGASSVNGELNLNLLMCAARRESVDTVFHFVIANVKKPPATLEGSARPFPDTVVMLTRILKQRRSRFP